MSKEYITDMSHEEMIEEIPVATPTPDEEVAKLLPTADNEDDDGNYLIVKFSKPYDFEGQRYDGIDLSCLEDIKGRELTALEKAFGKAGIVTTMPETTATYAKLAATKATGLPAEFFEDLPGKEVRKIKTAVTRFFYDED